MRQLLRLFVLTVLLAGLLVLPGGAAAADRDCADFANQREAQRWLEAHPGDPDRLDGDHDGRACESRPCPCASRDGSAAPAPAQAPPARTRKAVKVRARVVRVIDGDTIKVRLNGDDFNVRLLGIDTPETRKPGLSVRCGGPQATRHMKRLALRRGRGRTVTLRSDPTQDAIDRYDRVLAYVSVPGIGDLGRLMVRSGWAETRVYAGRPFQRVARYRREQSAAKRQRRGIYRKCGGSVNRRAR